MRDDIEAPWIGDPEPYINSHYNLIEPEEYMSDLFAYDPDICDGDFCPCDCDKCPKCWEDEEEDDD